MNTAKEDAAEAALQKLQGRGNNAVGSVGQGQGRVVGWWRQGVMVDEAKAKPVFLGCWSLASRRFGG